MGFLKFQKSELINLEYSLSREMVRSNRAGSYASTTIIGCNTRKYHGLLVCPLEEMGVNIMYYFPHSMPQLYSMTRILTWESINTKGTNTFPKVINMFVTLMPPRLHS